MEFEWSLNNGFDSCIPCLYTCMNFREFVQEKEKPWKATKKQVLTFWQSLQPNLPIQIDPVKTTHQGRRFDADGLRITGTSQFISSILSRMKEIMDYDNRPGLRLDVRYQQVTKGEAKYGEPKFVCYVHLLENPPKQVKIKPPKIG